MNRYGTTAYKLALPPNLANIYDVFHVSQLMKYLPNHTHVLEYEHMHLQNDITYELKLIKIVDTRIKQLRHRQVPLIKVVWQRLSQEEATWEAEESMRKNFPDIFNSDKIIKLKC